MSNSRTNIELTFDRLLKPSLVRLHDQFEATEIVAFPPGRTGPLNVFSIFVAEEKDDGLDQKLTHINGDTRIRISGLQGWSFGIFRYRILKADLRCQLDGLHDGQSWSPSGKVLQIGTLRSVPVHFVPADTFNKLKQFRHIAMRFDRNPLNYLAMIKLASTRL